MTETRWQRVRDGDSGAFSELFDDYSDLIYNVAFRRTGSWEAAEEIVSTVFLEAWRQRATVTEHNASIRPWLLGVALNLIRRHWRQADRQRRASLRLASEDSHLDHASDVADRLDAEQTMSRIMETLEQIPGDQRETVQLWAFSVIMSSCPKGRIPSRMWWPSSPDIWLAMHLSKNRSWLLQYAGEPPGRSTLSLRPRWAAIA
jgi:RNA polymerase sigma factor (sigma-70 family)